MSLRFGLFVPALLASLAPAAPAQPGRGVPPPIFLPPPLSNPQGLPPLPNGLAPGCYPAPPRVVPSPLRGPLPAPPIPPLILETPGDLLFRSGQKLPTIDVLFPAVPRMPQPIPPGPVVPVSNRK